MRCAHHQSCTWKVALEPDPHALDVSEYGWEADHSTKTFLPMALPALVLPAPGPVLKLLSCKCSSSVPCTTKGANVISICHAAFFKCQITLESKCNKPKNAKSYDTTELDNDENNNGEVSE